MEKASCRPNPCLPDRRVAKFMQAVLRCDAMARRLIKGDEKAPEKLNGRPLVFHPLRCAKSMACSLIPSHSESMVSLLEMDWNPFAVR